VVYVCSISLKSTIGASYAHVANMTIWVAPTVGNVNTI